MEYVCSNQCHDGDRGNSDRDGRGRECGLIDEYLGPVRTINLVRDAAR